MTSVDDRLPDDRRTRFEALALLVGEPLRRYTARRTDAETAKDVLSEAFLVLWRRLDEVPAGAELPWSYAVARHCLANAERSARRQRDLAVRVARLDPPRDAEVESLPDPDLHRALGALSAEDRELLRLSAWEDLAPREIAAVLGVSANAVSIRLHRARRRLARLLAAAAMPEGKTGAGAGHMTVEERRAQ